MEACPGRRGRGGIADFLKRGLETEGYDVTVAAEQPLCLDECLHLAPGQQATAFAVDHLESNRPQAIDNAEHRDVMEDRALVVGALEVVVGDLGAEMVDMVKTDVAGEELEDLGELQVGASL
jgi:hypothetical protein